LYIVNKLAPIVVSRIDGVMRRLVERVGLITVSWLVILSCALPLWVDLSWAIGMPLLYRWNRAQVLITNALIIGMTITLATFMTTEEEHRKGPLLYREHEMYVDGEWLYKKQVHAVIAQPHGDLFAIDHSRDARRERVKQPRTVEFITDEWGLRNAPGALATAEIVLVGDSFIVANGNTQQDMPASVLAALSGRRVASLAFPGAGKEYERLIADHLERITKRAAVYVFYFEGNDFAAIGDRLDNFIRALKNRYWRLEERKDGLLNRVYSKQQVFFRKVRAKSKLVTRELLDPEPFSVTYKTIAGKDVAFLRGHNAVASAKTVNAHILKDPAVLRRLGGVFFIPTKLRTYSTQLGIILPPRALSFLQASYSTLGIPVFDLTPALQAEAARALLEGQFVYWRDDTHWNRLGIWAAMKCVAAFLDLTTDQNGPYCRPDTSRHSGLHRMPVANPRGSLAADTRPGRLSKSSHYYLGKRRWRSLQRTSARGSGAMIVACARRNWTEALRSLAVVEAPA
jgi:SGNH hydrolase-like domain, acetyltransferase AlgX